MAAPYNVVLVMFDDAGIELFPQYDVQNKALGLNTNGGNPWGYPVLTNIETEFQRGLLFADAYACPWCSPTRYLLETGRYPFRTGVGRVVRRGHTSLCRYHEAASLSGVPEPNLPQALSNGGIDNAKVGKDHLRDFLAQYGHGGQGILDAGWGIFRGTIQNLDSDPELAGATSGYHPGYWNYNWFNNTDFQSYTQITAQYAMRRTRQQGQALITNGFLAAPFVLAMTCHGPHTPLGAPTDSPFSGAWPGLNDAAIDTATNSGSSAYPTASAGDNWTCVRAALENIDVEFGLLKAQLISLGVYANTVFIFVGDNGTPASVLNAAAAAGEDIQEPMTTIRTLGRGKSSIFRQGGRVPLFISGPADLVGGTLARTCPIRVSVTDLYATILELTGTTAEATVLRGDRVTDGVSLVPLIQNESNEGAWTRDQVYFEVFLPNGDPRRLVSGRTDPSGTLHQWDRALHAREGGTWYSYHRRLNGLENLFDLDADPGEIVPLALSGSVLDAMRARMDALLASELGSPGTTYAPAEFQVSSSAYAAVQ